MKKMQNGGCNVSYFRQVFFGMSSGVPVLKILVFASDFEFWIGLNEY